MQPQKPTQLRGLRLNIALFSFLFSAVLAGCGLIPTSGPDYQDESYRWTADLSQNGEDLLLRGEKIDRISENLDQLIFALNGSDLDPESFRTPEGQNPIGLPRLKLIEIQGNQARVEVINAQYLTQRMGSTGADAFLAEATFTITEHSEIESVYFLFEEGDHAQPGLYNRETFLGHWTPVEN